MPDKSPVAPSFAAALGQPAADRRIEILSRIGECGSISQAAREAGVSYKAAWQAIDTLTNLAGVALVHRDVGGAGGGGASLSDAGRQLLAAWSGLEQARQDVLQRLQCGGHDAPVAAQARRLALRTSMRNQLPCLVQALATRGQMAWVRLGLGSAVLTARITVESAELLGLTPGLNVLALCKATAVLVARTDVTVVIEGSGNNRLKGKATRVSRGPNGDEVSMQLSGGLNLVGFAPAKSRIRAGTQVLATLDEAAVVIALAD